MGMGGWGRYLGNDDGREVFEALDVGEQGVAQGVVRLGRQLVERRLDLHLHGLRGKVAGLHVLFELQELVRDLPRIHLEGTSGRRRIGLASGDMKPILDSDMDNMQIMSLQLTK